MLFPGMPKKRVDMHWTVWIVAILTFVGAGWSLFDGTRALIKGDYVTQKTGQHAGQLGPWSKVVSAIGIDPRSALMKLIFVILGATRLIFLVFFLLKAPWAWWGLFISSVLGLWYIPIGTISNVIVLLLLPNIKGEWLK